jgi:protein required for attachment to host cells
MFKGKTKRGVDIKGTQGMSHREPTQRWYVVASATEAKIFASNSTNGSVNLVETLENVEGGIPNHNLGSDRPGRVFNAHNAQAALGSQHSSSQHIYSSHESPHEHLISIFAKQLASRIENARTKNLFDELVLVAEPRFLGKLRTKLSKSTDKLVRDTIEKDLCSLSEQDVVTRLAGLLVRS